MQLLDLKASNSNLVKEIDTSREDLKRMEIELNRVKASEEKKKDLNKIDIENMKKLVESNMEVT